MSNVTDAFNDFGKYVIQQSRSNLTRSKKRYKGDLYNSLGYEIKEMPNSIAWTFYMEDYGNFVDKGVKGVSSSAKAPKSPYRFGTGSGKSGRLTKGIKGWVKGKNIQFRKPNGQFMSHEQTSWLIVGSLWNKGIETTNFFTRPIELGMKRLPDEILEAYALDFEDLIKNS